MGRFLAALFSVVALSACSTVKYVPVSASTDTYKLDSIAWHDSTVISYITKERYVDIVDSFDTLRLETEYAKSEAYVDTAMRVLRGSIENKSDVPVKTEIRWKERIVVRDSIVVREVPVEVETVKKVVPKWCWWCLGFCVLSVLLIALRIYLKFQSGGLF